MRLSSPVFFGCDDVAVLVAGAGVVVAGAGLSAASKKFTCDVGVPVVAPERGSDLCGAAVVFIDTSTGAVGALGAGIVCVSLCV